MEMPERWLEISFVLQDWYRKIMPGPLSWMPKSKCGDWQEVTRVYWKAECECRQSVTDMLLCSAREMKPPATLSKLEAHFVGLRIRCAIDFLGMLWPGDAKTSPFQDLSKRWSDQKAIQWLLVDLWHRRFDHWMKLHAIRIHGPFPFYGIEQEEPPPFFY